MKLTSLLSKYKLQIWIGLVILLATISLIWLPYWRVSQFGINNATENATLENQYRATLAQMLGGVAIGISLYYTWQKNNIAQEGQITERFTRAIDQLGKRALEIRLGGIYALERISKESKEDYWPIMEILTAYVRKNSSAEIVENKKVTDLSIDIQANESTTREIPKVKTVSLDIQAVLRVILRREFSFNNGEARHIDLRGTWLRGADLVGVHLERAYLSFANFEYADLSYAHLEEADLVGVHLERAYLIKANLEGANLIFSHLENAKLFGVHLEKAYLGYANLEDADLRGVYLEKADLEEAKNLTIDQLSVVKTLYDAKLDDKLLIPLKEKYPALFEEPKK